MAEFGDQEWEIEEMSLAGLFQRFEAARVRRMERSTVTATVVAQIHNSALAIRAPWVRHERAKPVTAADILKHHSNGQLDEAAFRRREAARYERRLKNLLRQGAERAAGYMRSRDPREAGLFRAALSAVQPESVDERAAYNAVAEVLL